MNAAGGGAAAAGRQQQQQRAGGNSSGNGTHAADAGLAHSPPPAYANLHLNIQPGIIRATSVPVSGASSVGGGARSPHANIAWLSSLPSMHPADENNPETVEQDIDPDVMTLEEFADAAGEMR